MSRSGFCGLVPGLMASKRRPFAERAWMPAQRID